MKVKLLGLMTLCMALVIQVSHAQEKTVSGTVTSVSDGLPIPGVNVIVKGTTRGVQTDFDGNYSIRASVGEVLAFSYVGMQTAEAVVGASNTINMGLGIDGALDEVIVVAYGTAKKGAFTGAATQINAEKIGERALSNVAGAIEGSSPGVVVNSANGQPGSGPSIRIRGFGSYSAGSDPLYVVDGMPYYGNVNAINSSDIESVTILKDAASTALYGNKAANGVVMITTKSGKNKKGQFTVEASSGVVSRSIGEYDSLGPDQYYEIMWESMRNSRAIPGVDTDAKVADANAYASTNIIKALGNNPYNVDDTNIVGIDGRINPNAQLLYADDLDWYDAISRTGFRQNYNVSYQGGIDKADFYVSLGYLDEEGYIKNSDFQRVSGRAKVNYEAADWFKTGFNIAGSTSQGNQAQATSSQSSSFVNPIRFTRNIGPIYNIYQHNPDGSYALDENGERQYYLNDNRPSGASTGRHILAEMLWNTDEDEITSLSAKAYADFNLAKGLTFTVNGSIDQRHRYNTSFENKYVGDGAPGGRASRRYVRRTVVGFNQLLNYETSFGLHNFSALAAHESLTLKNDNFYGSRSTIIADGNDELINFVTTTSLYSYLDSLNDESYFGRVNYDYDETYFLSASFRTDGTSKFAKDKRWGNFWSIGGAWRVDRENFIADQAWINSLKLRASYGEVGNNDGISYYAYQGLYDLGFNNQAESGFYQASLEARDLEWEKSGSYDIALEFRFFNRLNGVLEYYNRESSNLLFNVPLPLSSGSESIPQNIGTMYNRGFEVALDYDIIQTEDVVWNLGVNFATLENEFTKLPQEEIINGSKKLMVGRSIYDYWLKDWYGVDPADGAALYVPTQEAIDNSGSDLRTVDGTTVTTNEANAQYHYAGTAIPDLTGAINTSLSYKNFTLTALFTYQIGGEILDYNYRSLMSAGDYGNALHPDILNRWQKPGDITNVPRMDVSQDTNFDATSDRWLTDASYFNIKNINLGYTLPTSWTEGAGVKSARIYLNGENLLAFNERKGMDVQQNFSGTTSNVYTPSRVVSLGVNVNF